MRMESTVTHYEALFSNLIGDQGQTTNVGSALTGIRADFGKGQLSYKNQEC